MKPQPLKKRWLPALMLVGLAAQTAVAATHSALSLHPGVTQEQPAHDEERDGHEPASCSLCQAVRSLDHGLSVSHPSYPTGAAAFRCGVDAVPAQSGQVHWATPAPRAPPSPPSA